MGRKTVFRTIVIGAGATAEEGSSSGGEKLGSTLITGCSQGRGRGQWMENYMEKTLGKSWILSYTNLTGFAEHQPW
jgi:hypothetical protein